MKIGDKVRIIDSGKYFSDHGTWASRHSLKKWICGAKLPNNFSEKIGTVVAVGEHDTIKNYGILLGIEIENQTYIMQSLGCILVDSAEPVLYEFEFKVFVQGTDKTFTVSGEGFSKTEIEDAIKQFSVP